MDPFILLLIGCCVLYLGICGVIEMLANAYELWLKEQRRATRGVRIACYYAGFQAMVLGFIAFELLVFL